MRGDQPAIELLEESERNRQRECAGHAAEDFADSVLAIYASSKATRRRPDHIGSCILLDVDGTPVVATAAHITDALSDGAALFVAGPVRRHLVRILGGSIEATAAPNGDRRSDHSDGAFWRVPDGAVDDLGAASFLKASRLADNRAPVERRIYTALGYAVSRNKNRADPANRSIAVVPSMHTGTAVSAPELSAELRVSGDEHILVRFERQAQDADGTIVNTFSPKGFSGGALLDLGDFTSPAIYAGDTRHRALLAGMIIEYNKKHRALVAVNIGAIVNAITNVLRRPS
jgi:hypothetical protein